jgi:hypothetical protein
MVLTKESTKDTVVGQRETAREVPPHGERKEWDGSVMVVTMRTTGASIKQNSATKKKREEGDPVGAAASKKRADVAKKVSDITSTINSSISTTTAPTSRSQSKENGLVQDENWNPKSFEGLGKHLMTATIKSKKAMAGKKQTHATAVKPSCEQIRISDNVMTGVSLPETRKVSQVAERKCNSNADASSCSDDSIWELGLAQKARRSSSSHKRAQIEAYLGGRYNSEGSKDNREEHAEALDKEGAAMEDAGHIPMDVQRVEDQNADRQFRHGRDREKHECRAPSFDDAIENANADVKEVNVEASIVAAGMKTASFRGDLGESTACSHSDETQVRGNTTKDVATEKQPLCGFALEADSAAKAANSTRVTSSTMLQLVPISKSACQALFRDKEITYSEPTYLVLGSSKEYNISRKTIRLQMAQNSGADGLHVSQSVSSPMYPSTATLGRNTRLFQTGIKWSAVSRNLCDVSLIADRQTCSPAVAHLIMRKSAQDHAVCLNGTDLNSPIGKKIFLKDGDVVSLYGPTGFAYACHAHCSTCT